MASRRVPLLAVAAATALALAAASGVVLVLGGGDDDPSGASEGAESSSLELAPAGDLPSSVDEVVLGDLEGGQDRRLGELVGERPVVLNFFASWCGPCLEEMPAFEAVHQDLGDRVSFVGMAVRDRPETALEMVERTGVTYPTFADPGDGAITYFGAIGLPATVFIDADGEVAGITSRPLTENQLRGEIDELLGAGE